jgi:hypothetical protein
MERKGIGQNKGGKKGEETITKEGKGGKER